jgi:hypothetical protein
LFFEFGILGACRTKQVHHTDRLTGIGGEKGGIQGDIANIPASDVQARQFVKVKVFDWCIRRKRTSPDFGALRRIGKRELHHKANAPQKCRIQRALQFVVRIARPRYASIRWSSN